MANRGVSIFNEIRNRGAQHVLDHGLDQSTLRQSEFQRQQNDFNNYINSGGWTSEKNQQYRDQAMQAVKDLTQQQMQYNKGTNEYKQLDQYKTYYENLMPTFDRMDVTANVSNYLDYDDQGKWQNWHTQEDYDNQKAYLDTQRQALQTQIDEIQKKMEKDGEYYSPDLEALKSWQEQYDQLADALEARNSYDRYFPDLEHYTAYEKSGDYDYSSQLESTVADKTAELEQKVNDLTYLESKFGAPSQNLEVILGNVFAGATGAASTSASAARSDPEGYQRMLDLKREVAQLRSDLESAQKDLDLVRGYQSETIEQNFGGWDPNKDWGAEVEKLKVAYEKAEDGSADKAKIEAQLRTLAGDNWNGTNANGLYDDSNYLGRWYLQNIDVEGDRKKYEEIENQLKEMGVPTTEGTGWLNQVGAAFAAGIDPLAARDAINAENDEDVIRLRQEKKDLMRNLDSAAQYQNRADIGNRYGGLGEEQQAKYADIGKAAMTEDGKSYTDANGRQISLKNFDAILDDETDPVLRDMVYSAIGAELSGEDIGYSVADIMDAYSERLAQTAGYKAAKNRADSIGSDVLRWLVQVPGQGTVSGLNQALTGAKQFFSDDLVENNKAFYAGQWTREDLKRYGDERLFTGASVGGSNISQLLYDTAQTTGNMLPMIAASSLLSLAGAPEAAGAVVGATIMGMSSAGNAYQQALNEGWEKDDAKIFSVITGAAEGGLQYLLGGISSLGGVGEEQLLAMTAKMNSAALRVATNTAIHIGSETVEELLQNRLESYLRSEFQGDQFVWWDEDDWYTVMVTALSTGLLEGPGSVITEARNTKTGNAIAGNIIPSKGLTQRQQQWNAALKEVGETMQGDAAVQHSLLAFARNTNLVEAGGTANQIAERMNSGKMEKNATNLGLLYSEILSEYQERYGKVGIQAAMAGVIGGGQQYHLEQTALNEKAAAEKQLAEVRKANPNASVLDMNASKLMELGVKEKAAKEYAVLLNKIMSGTKLTEAETDKFLNGSTAAEASLRLLDQMSEYRETSVKLRLDKASVAEGLNEMVQQFQRRKAERKAAAEVVVGDAQQTAVDKAIVSDAAQGADRKTFYGLQEQVDPSVVEQIQNAEAGIESADAKLKQIRETPLQTLGMAKMVENADEANAGSVNAVIDNRRLSELYDERDSLQERASNLSAIRMPSRQQATELADIRQQLSGVQRQIDSIADERAQRAIERARQKEAASQEAARKEESAELARNSSDAVDTIILPNGNEMTRSEYVDNAVDQAKEENQNLSDGEIAKIKEEANAEFNRIAEQTGGKVTEDGRRNESSNPAEERNDVGDAADRGEDRGRSDQPGRPDLGRSAAVGTELFAANSANRAVYASADATVTDVSQDQSREAELEKDHPGITGLAKYLLDSGFTSVRFVTKGQIFVESVNPETGKVERVSVAALVRGTEMVLSLDFNKKGYDFRATAEHERTHLRLRALDPDERRSFISSTLQNLLGRDVYVNAFTKYLAEYGTLYEGDPAKIAHMINEEMFCDMVAGINEWGTDLGDFKDDIGEMLRDSNFDAVTQAAAEGIDTYAPLNYEETEPNAMPYGLEMKEKIDLSDPFRHDVDTSKPPESRPLPGEEPMHEEQQLMSIQSFTEATGFRLEKNAEGMPWAIVDQNGNRVTNVTPDMMRETPLGKLVGAATRRVNPDGTTSGHISEAAAKKQYKMLADVMNMIIRYDDAAVVWELVGSQLFSGIKANSDTQYNLTIDFGTICRKTQAIVDAMSATMKKLGRGLSRREVEAVYLETGLAGEATPCPVCYVFSRWMGIGGLLDDINNFQNSLFDINQQTGEFTWKDGAEQQALELMSLVEQDAQNFYNKLSAEKKKEYTDAKTGEMKLGKILSDLKTKPNNAYESALRKLNMHQQAVGAINNFLNLMPNATAEKAKQYAALMKSVKNNVIRQADTDAIVQRLMDQAADASSDKAKLYSDLIKAFSSPRKSGNTFDAVEAQMAQAKKDAEPYDTYQWLASTVFTKVENGVDEDGNTLYRWGRNERYKPVLKDTLFDLNKGGDFAKNYPLTWAFRTGKGCAMGKAIMPYSDARVGETIQGVASGNVKNIKIGNDVNAFLNGDTKEQARILTDAINNMRRQNLIGGMRLQSTSDFRFEWGSDYLMTFFELQAVGANVQLYTKVIEAVDFLASTGADCNLSVMPLGDGIETYIDPETGETKKRLAFSGVTGVDGAAAIEKAHQYDNVQLILVGINDENIRMALEGTDVTFVIPFHGSGQSVHQVQSLMDLLGENLDVTKAQDYSKVQTDHAIPGRAEKYPELQAAWDLRMDIIQGAFWDGQNLVPLNAKQQAILDGNQHLQKLYNMFYEDTQNKAYHCFLGPKQAEQIFPYEYWDTTTTYATADRNGQIFQDYCASLGVIPRFSGKDSKGKDLGFGNFTKDKGYWKLLIDRKMYENTYDADGNWTGYGKYRDQKKVTTTNIEIGTLNPQAATDAIPEKARTKEIHPEKTAGIVDKSIKRIEAQEARGDKYDLTKVTDGFRKKLMKANQALREANTEEAEQQMSLQQGEDTTPVAQTYTSKDTSINSSKLPVVFTKPGVKFVEGGTNIDIGGGRFDNATQFLKEKYGVKNSVFDPYNRDRKNNAAIAERIKNGERFDTATISNVLNVIDTPEARANVILEAAKAIKPDGTAYFTVYEGDAKGGAAATTKGWQENRKLSTYRDEIRQYFNDVPAPRNGVITARDPKANLPQAAWEVEPGEAMRFSLQQGEEAIPGQSATQRETRSVIQPKGKNLTKSTAVGYNENAQQRFSKQEGEDNGRTGQAVVARSGDDVDARNERRLADQLGKLLSRENWAGAYVEAARRGDSGVEARTAWRSDEKRQRRIINFAADFLEHHNYQGIRVDRAENAKGERLFEYGVSDFLDYIFDTMARDPQGLMQDLKAHMRNADAFIEGLNKAMELDEEPNYRRSFYNWTKADEEYMDAIERNDVAKLEEMVTRAAKKAGYKGEFYQHTPIRFEEFSKGEFGFHIGSMTQAATIIYNKLLQRWNHGDYRENPHAFIPLFAKITNPYVLPKVDRGNGRLTNDYNVWYPHEIAEYLKETGDFDEYTDELQTIIDGPVDDEYDSPSRELLTSILEAKGYDALQYTNAAEGNKKRDSGTAYIIWNPEQLKSADLITYDKKGNVIPISERFNENEPEYRYSIQEEETTNPFPKDTLAGDLMNLALSGDVEAMNNWLNREMDKYNQKKEQAKIIPPRVPTRSFVPKPTEEEMAAIEKKRLDQIGQYGAHKPSDQRVSDDYVLPKKDELGRGRSKFVQNVASASNVLDEPARDHTKRFAFTSETAVYDVDENDADIKAAKEKIKDKGIDYCVQNFLENAEDMTWKDYAGNTVTKVLAMGQQLLIETSTNGTYRDYLDVLSALTLLANQAGKSLQAFNMLKKSGPIGELYYVQKTVNHLNNKQYAKMIEAKKMSAITVDPDLEKAVVMAKTEDAREKAMNKLIESIAKQVPVTIMDKWNTWRHFAMLGNARTHIRNVFGNAIFMPLRFAKNLLATTGETIAVKTGWMKEEDRTKSFTISRELRDFAKKDALVMQKELQGNGKYNPAQEILDARQIFAWRGLDKASKWNGQMLEKEDWWFLAPAYQKALGMALMNSGFTVEELENSTEGQKALVRARRIAIEEAQRATYRDFSVAAAALNRLKRGGGMGGILLEGVLPFTKTPINILRRGIEYSPVGIATALFGLAKDFHSGSIDASQFIDRMSAGLSGTMLAVLGAVLAKAGWLRGKKDDKEEDFDTLQGYQDYSLQIGDVSMTIDWAAPGALPLFTGVAAWNMMQGEEELSPAMIWDAVLLIAEPMMSLSMLDGLNKTLSAASYAGENEKLVSIASTAFTSYIGQAFPTLGGQLARSIDGTRRQTYVDKNSPIPAGWQRFIQSSVQNKIPVWEEGKAPYIDQWGREDTVKRKWAGALENFLSPSYINLVNTTDVDEEIGNLYETTKAADILPSSPTKKIGDKQLTADEYVSYAKDVGTAKYNLLAQMFSDPRYRSLSDEEKVIAIKKIYDYANYAGKYHLIPEYDIRKNGGVWVQEAEAMPNDLLRYNRIWEAIEKALED